MALYKVTSEIHTESNNSALESSENHVTKTFSFAYPDYFSSTKCQSLQYDEDGDLILSRPKRSNLSIEYSTSTELQLVGLQIWRGALVLADYILSHPELFEKKNILELGSGVGLTSIVASLLANEIVCTDVDAGGILKLIEANFKRNKQLVKSKFSVMELNFLDLNWSSNLREKLKGVSVILAADVIYDDEVTNGFVNTLAQLLDQDPSRVAYVALEKRYVFTIANLESVAPMYEEFLRCIARRELDWIVEHIEVNFPQYFDYKRVDQMILMRISSSKGFKGPTMTTV